MSLTFIVQRYDLMVHRPNAVGRWNLRGVLRRTLCKAGEMTVCVRRTCVWKTLLSSLFFHIMSKKTQPIQIVQKLRNLYIFPKIWKIHISRTTAFGPVYIWHTLLSSTLKAWECHRRLQKSVLLQCGDCPLPDRLIVPGVTQSTCL